MTPITALIDFVDPLDSAAPRLRHAFGAPCAVLTAHTLAEVRPLLDAVQAAARQGQWCVGHVAYEAAPAFDAALAVHVPDGPLAWFAVYDQALPWPDDDADAQGDASFNGRRPVHARRLARPWRRFSKPLPTASCTRST